MDLMTIFWIWLAFIAFGISFIIGALFGYRSEKVKIPIEEPSEKEGEEPKKKYVVVKMKLYKIWDMWWMKLKRFLQKYVWCVEAIFLYTHENGLIAERDIGKIDKDGNLKWMNSKHKLNNWNPQRIMLKTGRSLGIFLDETPVQFDTKTRKLMPVKLKTWLQQLSDSLVMSKNRYPKQKEGIPMDVAGGLFILLLLFLGIFFFKDKIGEILTELIG